MPKILRSAYKRFYLEYAVKYALSYELEKMLHVLKIASLNQEIKVLVL